MGYGQQGASFCSTRGIPIVSNAIASMESQDTAARQKSMATLADLGAWAVGRTVRDACVAARLAEGTAPVELTPEIEAKFEETNGQFLHERKLDDDALFTPILQPLPKEGAPVVGVVLEPTWRMNDAMLGYGDRVWSASICRSLGAAKRDYATLDIRSALANGFPPPSRVPVLILSATALRNYSWMHIADLDRQLKAYLDSGGRVLWIGGDAKPPGSLATIANAMTKTEKQLLPVPDDQILKMHLVLLGDTTGLLSIESQWGFVRSPSLKVGWSQPLCPWSFTDPSPADFDPLLELTDDTHKIVVGVLWKNHDSKQFKGAYLPVYAIAPHLLTESQLLVPPPNPRHGSAGRTNHIRYFGSA